VLHEHDTWLVHCDRVAGVCSGCRLAVVVGRSRTYPHVRPDNHVRRDNSQSVGDLNQAPRGPSMGAA